MSKLWLLELGPDQQCGAHGLTTRNRQRGGEEALGLPGATPPRTAPQSCCWRGAGGSVVKKVGRRGRPESESQKVRLTHKNLFLCARALPPEGRARVCPPDFSYL